jgi:decaprenylphospho-beta-D-erythro-pentofuranosid-2-ulose 2-reductase
VERFAVRNALGAVQSLLVLGGSSDIGAAIAERLVPTGCRRIVLAGRHPGAMEPVAERLRALGAEVAVTAWDATDIAGHADAVKAAWRATGPPTSIAWCWPRACWATRSTWPATPAPLPS